MNVKNITEKLKFWNRHRYTLDELVPLTPENVDLLSEKIARFLNSFHIERANRIRIRFSMEEAILRWMDHFGPALLHVEMNVFWRRPYITLTLPGEQYNPLVRSENDLGEWAENLYSGLSLSPVYNYRNNFNVLQLKLNPQTVNPALILLGAVMIGAVFGVLGKFLLPEALQTSAVQTIFGPIEGVFLRILNASSGPVIFLSVLTSICGIGMLPRIGKSGKTVVIRFLSLTLAATLVTLMLSYGAFRLPFSQFEADGSQFTSMLDFFLKMVPNDMLTPLIEGNSPQMILVAIIIGSALITNSTQTGTLRNIVEQADLIGLTVAGWVSKLTPFFVAMLLIFGVWNGSVNLILGLWKPVLIYLLISGGMLLFRLWVISNQYDVTIKNLWLKIRESFRIAFINASVDSAIGETQNSCEQRLGISKKLTDYALPLGMVIYMPSGCVSCMIVILYAAECYHITVSPVWLLIAVILTFTLVAATPPVAGIGLLTYTAIFGQLGIPHEALTMAMVADITMGFAISAFNLVMLELEMVLQAGNVGLLDKDILERKMKTSR